MCGHDMNTITRWINAGIGIAMMAIGVTGLVSIWIKAKPTMYVLCIAFAVY